MVDRPRAGQREATDGSFSITPAKKGFARRTRSNFSVLDLSRRVNIEAIEAPLTGWVVDSETLWLQALAIWTDLLQGKRWQ